MKLNIKSNIGDYSAFFNSDFSFFENLRKTKNCIFIIDKNVYQIYQNKLGFQEIDDNLLLFNASEENKTIDYVLKIYDFLIKKEAKRNMTIISIGGGITQDVTGFVASTMYRGIGWIYIPTTFLAQTDSCIGSKTSLNFKAFKNLIGSFYPPKEIYICPEFIETLDDKDFYSGLGEAIKLQLMKPNNNLDLAQVSSLIEGCKKDHKLLLNLIFENLSIKMSYMEDDEFDLGKRNLLNFGHCFGHALETSSNYEVPHGIAVTIGIIFANCTSMCRGVLSEKLYQEINDELLLKNIFIKLKEGYFDPDPIYRAMQNDKKRVGKDLSIVIPDLNFNLCKVNDLKKSEFLNVLDKVRGLLL